MVTEVQVNGIPAADFVRNETIKGFGTEAVSDFHYVSKGIKKSLSKVISEKDSHWKETNGEVKVFTKEEIDELNRKENRIMAKNQNLIERILELVCNQPLSGREIATRLESHPKGISSALRWLMKKVGNDFSIVGVKKDGSSIYGLKPGSNWKEVFEKYRSTKGTKSVKKVILKRRQPAPDIIPEKIVPWKVHIDACHLIAQLESLLTILLNKTTPDSDKIMMISLGREAIENWNNKYSK